MNLERDQSALEPQAAGWSPDHDSIWGVCWPPVSSYAPPHGVAVFADSRWWHASVGPMPLRRIALIALAFGVLSALLVVGRFPLPVTFPLVLLCFVIPVGLVHRGAWSTWPWYFFGVAHAFGWSAFWMTQDKAPLAMHLLIVILLGLAEALFAMFVGAIMSACWPARRLCNARCCVSCGYLLPDQAVGQCPECGLAYRRRAAAAPVGSSSN